MTGLSALTTHFVAIRTVRHGADMPFVTVGTCVSSRSEHTSSRTVRMAGHGADMPCTEPQEGI